MVTTRQQEQQLAANQIEQAAATASTKPKEYTDLIHHHRHVGKDLDKITRQLTGQEKILRTIDTRIADSTQLLKSPLRQAITDPLASNTFILTAKNQIRRNEITLALTQTSLPPQQYI